MSDILGYDCDGKPLRSGDRIVVIKSPDIKPDRSGQIGTITQLEPDPWIWLKARASGFYGPIIEYRRDDGRLLCGEDCDFRLLPRKDAGDWSEIEKETGWRPHVGIEA